MGPIPLIGQHISYKEPVQHRRVRLRATLTALASVAVFLLAISAAYFLLPLPPPQAAHIVAVDINPSLELETDEEWTVIAIRPLNEEAKGLMKSLDSGPPPGGGEVCESGVLTCRGRGLGERLHD